MGSDDHTAWNRSTYDRIAARYAENQARQHSDNERWFSTLYEAFIARMPVTGRVADLGCGPASDGARLARGGFQVVAMDLSMGMLSVAASRLPGHLAQADLRAVPIRSQGLDGVWCCAALLHVPEEDTERVLAEFARIIRPGGVLALVTAIGESSCLEEVPYAPDERRWFVYRSTDRLREQLRQANFDVCLDSQITRNRIWLTILAERL